MPTQSKKVLIVEDEKPLAQALYLKLKKNNIESEIAYNGEEALEILEKQSFDLILLDLIMPQMDGFAMLEELKKKGIKTPVVVTSNLGQEEDIKRVMEMGVKEYIIKSNTPIVEIVNKVKAILFK